MKIETFTKGLLGSGMFETYTATGFFGVSIFFVLNFMHYTALEMVFGIIAMTIVFKGISNIMLSMIISLVDLTNQEDSLSFEKSSTKLESLVKDLALQEASIQSNKVNNNHNQ